jgi:hypothetical protein
MSRQYLIHYNGYTPYLVVVDSNSVSVFDNTIEYVDYNTSERSNNSDIVDTDKLDKLFHWLDPVRVFVGESPENENTRNTGSFGPDFSGNSILVEITPFHYVFIGQVITTFSTNQVEIISFVSEIGNNDVPYPYATDENGSIYLLIENTILDKVTDDFSNDPYGYFYSNQSKYSEIFEFKYFTEIAGSQTNQVDLYYTPTPIFDFNCYHSHSNLYFCYLDNKPDEIVREQDFVEMMKKIETEFSYRPLIVSYLRDRLL